MRVTTLRFISQAIAEAMVPPPDTALISITNTDRPDAALKNGWKAILRLSFDDIDPITYPGDYQGMKEMSFQQACLIAKFANDVLPSCTTLVVHCRYGVARSAAVAKAIAEYANLEFPAEYNQHNDYVYTVVRDALMRYGK